MNFDETATHLTQTWGKKTLNEFRNQALLEAKGTVFESVRAQEGQRLIILMCATDSKQIDMLDQIMDFGEQSPVDWDDYTLGHLALDSAQGGGSCYHEFCEPSGRRVSLALCATSPEAVRTLESIFKL
jgi:hypothetical protein